MCKNDTEDLKIFDNNNNKKQNPTQNQLHQYEEIHNWWASGKVEGYVGAGEFLRIPVLAQTLRVGNHEVTQETYNH